jgi:polygalacturonase
MLSVGGIPARTTLCATINASGGDDTNAINAAIGNCPAGQVVSLGAGTFTIGEGNLILLNKGITLRGQGAGKTTLQRTGGAVFGSGNPGSNPTPIIYVSPAGRYTTSYGAGTALTADALQGQKSSITP